MAAVTLQEQEQEVLVGSIPYTYSNSTGPILRGPRRRPRRSVCRSGSRLQAIRHGRRRH
jgi:hypothetical protein